MSGTLIGFARQVACVFCLIGTGASPTLAAPELGESLVLGWETEAYRRAVESGGPGKDGIPSIDKPRFWHAARAGEYLRGNDIVFGVYQNGLARAYPQRIMVWHEIANDNFNGDKLSITYCPLTGTAQGFFRGDTELGVSGRLLNSNVVMYDRATDSWWSQILATAIRGPLEGKTLAEVRVVWTTWKRWLERYPETEVLSNQTGYARNYFRDPYGGYNPVEGYYRRDTLPMFQVMNYDDRYPSKQVILGFRTADIAVAVDRETLRRQRLLNHVENGEHFYIVYDPGLYTGWVFRAGEAVDIDYDNLSFGTQGVEGLPSGLEPVVAIDAMWFAWAAFYPSTRVIDEHE